MFFFKKLYSLLKYLQTFDSIKLSGKHLLQETVQKLEADEDLNNSFCALFASFTNSCRCDPHKDNVQADSESNMDPLIMFELEESIILHILHNVILYMAKVHLSDLTSKFLDTEMGKKKTYQIRHSSPSASKVDGILKSHIDFPCGLCGNECVEIKSMKCAKFEDLSVECNGCQKWYHYICMNLTGKEPELQEGSQLPYFCSKCKSESNQLSSDLNAMSVDAEQSQSIQSSKLGSPKSRKKKGTS